MEQDLAHRLVSCELLDLGGMELKGPEMDGVVLGLEAAMGMAIQGHTRAVWGHTTAVRARSMRGSPMQGGQSTSITQQHLWVALVHFVLLLLVRQLLQLHLVHAALGHVLHHTTLECRTTPCMRGPCPPA